MAINTKRKPKMMKFLDTENFSHDNEHFLNFNQEMVILLLRIKSIIKFVMFVIIFLKFLSSRTKSRKLKKFAYSYFFLIFKELVETL